MSFLHVNADVKEFGKNISLDSTGHKNVQC